MAEVATKDTEPKAIAMGDAVKVGKLSGIVKVIHHPGGAPGNGKKIPPLYQIETDDGKTHKLSANEFARI